MSRDHRGGYPAKASTGRLPKVPAGPAPGSSTSAALPPVTQKAWELGEPPLMNITDETRAAARARWAEMWGDNGQIDRAGEQMIDDILEVAAPLIAAQAIREDQERTEWGVRWHGADVILGDEAQSRAVADRHANAVAVHRRAAGPWIEVCCDAPNMVWEHSRAGKDHFRCAGCGGGMTKARATT